MKKVFFILSLFTFCICNTANSQKARVGVTGGINLANISRTIGGVDKDGDFRIGVMGGMMVDVPLCKKGGHISFQPDLRYTQKGSAEPLLTPNVQNYIALRYAELASNFVYNFNNKKGGTFYLGGGPYLSFPLPSKKVQHSAGTPDITTDISFGQQVANDFKGVDYGADFTMGYRIKNGVFLALNYTQGARNLVPSDKLDLPGGGDDKMKNISFGIRVGFLFKAVSAK